MNTIYHIHFVVNTIMKSLWPFPKEADLLLKLDYYKRGPSRATRPAAERSFPRPRPRWHFGPIPDPNRVGIYGQRETMVSSSKQNIKSQGFLSAVFCHLLDKGFTLARCQKERAKSGNGKTALIKNLNCSVFYKFLAGSRMEDISVLWHRGRRLWPWLLVEIVEEENMNC